MVKKLFFGFVESICFIWFMIMLSDEFGVNKVVVIIFVVFGEGKIMILVCFGWIFVMVGSKMLVIDCDICCWCLLYVFVGCVGWGWFDSLMGCEDIKKVIYKDVKIELEILLAGKFWMMIKDVFGI